MALYTLFSFLKRYGGIGWRQWDRVCASGFSSFLRMRSGLIGCVLCGSVLLASCSGLSFGGSTPVATRKPQPTPTPATTALSHLHWCDKPLMVFRNLAASGTPGVSAGKPTTMTDWTQVKAQLGFSVFLPSTLPTGSCLVSVSGTVQDPILGSNFVIGYVLPDHGSVTFSQAPLSSKSVTFRCDLAPTTTNGTKATPTAAAGAPQAPEQFCSGARDTTNITFSARGKTEELQQFFNALQSDVNWIPAS